MCCVPSQKHVSLVQAVYPGAKAAEARPNSSELQYLTFYASSRPKRLVKIGNYLQQKTGKDIYWQRQNDVLVTTDICTALIEKCQANLSLFATPILQIVGAILRAREPSQVERACRTFTVFCRHHDPAGFESENLYQSYLPVLRELCAIASATGSAPSSPSLSGSAGTSLQALKALDSAASRLYIPDLRRQLDPIVSCVLGYLSSCPDAALQEHRLAVERRDSTYEPSSESTAPAAMRILRKVFDTNAPQQVIVATTSVLESSEDQAWLCRLLPLILGWVPINLRFHVVDSCLDPDQSRSVVLVKALLQSKASLVGLSVVDVLDSLTILLQRHTGDKVLVAQYRETVALLASHTHYRTQLTDIASCLLNNMSDTEAGQILVACLRELIEESSRGPQLVSLTIWQRHIGTIFMPGLQRSLVQVLAMHIETSPTTQHAGTLRQIIAAMYRLSPGDEFVQLCNAITPHLDGQGALLMLHLLYSTDAPQALGKFCQTYGLKTGLTLPDASAELARQLDVPELSDEGIFRSGSQRSFSAASARTSSRAVSRSAGQTATAVSHISKLKEAIQRPLATVPDPPRTSMSARSVERLFDGIELQPVKA